MVNTVMACRAQICCGQNLRSRPPGQHVPPYVRYGTTCLLIRNTIGSVSFSVEWGLASFLVSYFVIFLNHMVQEGSFAAESLALQAGPFVGEFIANHDVLL
jgi:hypothetical protein